MQKDPVCNMDVNEDEGITAECDGKIYHFCSEGCRDKFLTEKTCKLPRPSYDLIIIGAGPAGLTAAVYAATLRISAFLIAKDIGGQAIDSTKIENYMGFNFTRDKGEKSVIPCLTRNPDMERYWIPAGVYPVLRYGAGMTKSGGKI